MIFRNRAPLRDVFEILSICLIKEDVLGGMFRYRIGIGFARFVVRILIVLGTISIPILYQTDPFKIVLF